MRLGHRAEATEQVAVLVQARLQKHEAEEFVVPGLILLPLER